MDLDESERAQPSVRRVVRIGAPLRPAAPKVRPPAPRAEPAPLTKKQRQSRKKAERQREERAQAAETQEQRLRAHRRELEEIRSRQQWAAERRKEIRRPPAGAAPNRAQGAPSLVDGRLIWM
ncbi:hypothetical protein IWQ57_004160 [Coemansia nantahalensis]|nr:hypothetical protein IWQ57_004160 [Coemansia nantahalensis]